MVPAGHKLHESMQTRQGGSSAEISSSLSTLNVSQIGSGAAGHLGDELSS